MKAKGYREALTLACLRTSAVIVAAIVVSIFGYLVINGYKAITWEFLTQPPMRGMTEGGIHPAIVGSAYLMALTIVFNMPLGVLSAIYLSEYARFENAKFVTAVRVATRMLAGVPSIVYGLLGLALFVLLLGFGFSIISASLTLSLLTLPVVIAASEEALRSVPTSYREGALALGATMWQTVRHAVLPYALPGIMTASILGISRAAGETAPLLMTGVAYYLPRLPSSVFDQFMALPYHVFSMSTQSPNPVVTRPIQFGTVLVLLLMVLLMNVAAIYIRYRSYRVRRE
ncbi:MAG: phosphate ABC transporter permease PstA [Candidatus Bathyarchaeia archaeon]